MWLSAYGFHTGLAVVDAHRWLAPAEGCVGHRPAVQGAVGHAHSAPGEKVVDLDQRQVVLDPAADPLGVGIELVPSRP